MRTKAAAKRVIDGHRGGVQRAKNLSAKRRREIASAGGKALWARLRAALATAGTVPKEAA